MQLDVVIDVVCPWCYVGKKQLDLALNERPNVITSLHWRPYQLGPDTPKEGVDRKEHYQKKFGNNPRFQAMWDNLKEQGEKLDIKFDFDSECRIANTLDAHRLIRWAYTPGVQSKVVEDLMYRYFVECAFLGDHDLLVDVAEKANMDGALVRDLLSSDKDKDLVKNEVFQAGQMGIQGVPMFIFNGKAGVSGAQEASVLVEVIDKLQAETVQTA